MQRLSGILTVLSGGFFLTCWISTLCHVQAFVVLTPSTTNRLVQVQPSLTVEVFAITASSTSLLAKRGRGNLGSIIEDGGSVSKTRTAPKKRSKRKPTNASSSSSKKNKDDAAAISPSLQEWISKTDSDNDDDEEYEEEETAEETSYGVSASSGTPAAGSSFERFEEDDDASITKSKKKKNPTKNALKMSQKEEQNTVVMELVEKLEDILETAAEKKQSADIDTILSPIRTLMAQPQANGNLRQLIAGNKRLNYRLAWVGSDDAICHIGTGLHKVPLARLQEIFLSCMGKSRLEVYEVIRIIGPFPNVRNTLEGAAKVGKRNVVYDPQDEEKTVSELKITYDSMIDGTGKQITAGMEDNVRKVDMHIAFCDENAIVAIVPPLEGGDARTDLLEDNGAHVLFFAREEMLDEKLDALRVL
mgnify:CR=1 FL=1